VVSLLHSLLETLALADEFAADIDIGDVRPHGPTGQQAALHQMMRIVAQDFPVLTGAGLGFVGVDQKLAGAAVAGALLGHEGPFERGGGAGAAPAAQPRCLNLADDPIASGVGEFPGTTPGPA